MTKPDPSQWIDISDALSKATAGSILSEFSASDVIEEGLVRGKLRARARKLEFYDEDGDTHVLKVGKGIDSKDVVYEDVPKNTWNGGRFSAGFFEQLSSGVPVRFCTQQGYVAVSGLQLHRRGFDKLLRDALSWDVTGVMKGRSKNEHAWAQFLITAVSLERDGELTEQTFPDAKSLLARFVDELDVTDEEEKKLDPRTLRPYVEGLWRVLVRGHR